MPQIVPGSTEPSKLIEPGSQIDPWQLAVFGEI